MVGKTRTNDSLENQKGSKNTGKQPVTVKKPKKKPSEIRTASGGVPDIISTIGRPTIFSEETATKIIELLSSGIFLREICRMEGMPAWTTVYAWMDADAVLNERIARARERGEEALALECLHIADSPLMGEETETSENGMKVKRADMLGHRKLQIDTRMRLLAKWNPKKWGEKVAIGGADDLPPLRSMNEKDLDQQIAELQAKEK